MGVNNQKSLINKKSPLAYLQDIRKDFDIVFAYGDHHIPHNDEYLDKLILKLIGDLKPDMIIDGGDMVSGDALSMYNKTEDQQGGLDKELALLSSWQISINEVSPSSKKILLYDNHFCRRYEDLYQRESQYRALASLPENNLHFILEKNGWKLLYDYKWKDKIFFCHGDEKGTVGNRNSPVNNARMLTRSNAISVVKWHSHATGYEMLPQRNSIHHAIQLGHIMDTKKVNYIRHKDLSSTSQSIAIFYLSKKTTEYHFTIIPIIENRFMVNGILYS